MIRRVWQRDFGDGISMILASDGTLWVHENNQIGLDDADCDNYLIFWPPGYWGELQ